MVGDALISQFSFHSTFSRLDWYFFNMLNYVFSNFCQIGQHVFKCCLTIFTFFLFIKDKGIQTTLVEHSNVLI